LIQITPHMRVLVAIEPVDFRRGIDGLAQLCRAVLKEDPMTGTVIVFRNRQQKAIKILIYDGQGYWLCQNHLCPYCISVDHSSAFSVRSLQRPLLG
jgi:transposase